MATGEDGRPPTQDGGPGRHRPRPRQVFWPPDLGDGRCLLGELPAVAFAVVPKLTDGASVCGGDRKGLARLEGRFWNSETQARGGGS